MKKYYYQLNIFIDELVFEPIIGFLSEYKNSGFLEEDNKLTCYFESENWQNTILSDLKNYITVLKNRIEFTDYDISLNKIQDQNWNKKWEESIEPIEISKKIVIKPTWKEYPPKPGQLIIQIDPKMAFGTGHHETTRLCISTLEKYIKPNCTLLDMGTGTGVIAIAAILLGAKEALGIDNDEWAYENALENIILNQVKNKVNILLGSQNNLTDEKFDIITSNIDFRTNFELIEDYPNRLFQDGVIILSGLLVTDLPNMKKRIKELGLKVIEEKTENEWGCLAVSGRE